MKSSLFTIEEIDTILNILLSKYKATPDEKLKQTIRKFIRSFDNFYSSAAEFDNKTIEDIRCELISDIYMVFE